MIELRGVTKIYELGGEKIYALRGVSLKIDDGAFLAVVGPSGSGKSTLANIIGGLDTPDEGQVLVDGENIDRLSDKKLSHFRNKKVGFIFQTFNLQTTLTALENVMIPLIFSGVPLKTRKNQAAQCLEAVGLKNRMYHKPTQLSGGQRQRVCIARALVNNPQIIIADEPTGNLDSKKGAEIIQMLEAMNREIGMTLIVITHDPAVAKRAKKTLIIKDGSISR